MKIGINVDKLSRTNKRGVSVYIYQILKELSEIDNKNDYILYSRRDIGDKPFLSNPRFSLSLVKSNFGLLYWTYFKLPKQAIEDKVDIFFSPAQNYPFIFMKPYGIKTVTSVLDIAFRIFPKHFRAGDKIGLDINTKIAVRRSDKIIAISESTKRDIIKYYKTDDGKIDVVYLASRMGEKCPKLCEIDVHNALNIKKSYILFVGAIQPRKNIIKLVDAFEICKDRNSDIGLVICGERGWLYQEILARISRSRYSKDIFVTGGVSEKELKSIYCKALMFALPSLYEGFGIPVLEAMSLGVPVIVPNNSSFPELVGDAGLYVDEYNAEDIADKISMIMSDPGLGTELAKKGKLKAREFSWKITAKKHLEIFESI
ncbi:MAG: glycosyltransferase family 1 protein [Candidatus Paceibacterota bacterium]|jgi:glycosyltransferase involved in cell wall biosynthesis